MSVATELTRIQTAKADIKASIEAKGVTVPSDALIDQYADYVDEISGGGGAATPSNLSDWTYDSFGKITSAVIRNGVTSLNYDNGFNGCGSLTSVTIPDSVTSIGVNAFNECTGLTSVTIPDSVTSIGIGAFANCSGLTSITIPDSVTSIGSNAFGNCSSLTSVTIGSGVTSIGSGAFAGSALTNITINATTPPSAGSTTHGIFADTPIENGDGWIYVPEESVDLYKASSGFSAYSSRIVSIGGSCPGKLCGIDIDGNDFLINNEDEDVILGMNDNIRDYNPVEATVGNMIEIIDMQAFDGCTSLTSVTIPNSVTSIGNNAFDGCTSLTSVTIPNSVIDIGESAFRGCESLTSVTIPDSVTSIGGSAFWNCTSLTSITIPDSVTSIGDSAFDSCSGLTSITIPNSVTSISEWAFINCSSLTSITIPDSVTTIGIGAFQSCESLESVTINATTPPTLGMNAFNNTSPSLVIYVPAESLEEYNAAENWSNYTIVEIPSE